jgi:predicted dinucleotide-binding enzyme
MKMGIIGACNIGGTLTRRFTALGHKVFVANSRGPETLANLATGKERKPEWRATARSPGTYEAST